MRAPISILLALASVVAASDDKTDRATLRGIKSVCTIVEVTGPAVNQERLRVEMDGVLAAAGITLDKNATTCLYLHVRPLAAIARNNKPVGLYAIDFNLEFLQKVTLARDASVKAFAPTWSVENLANVPADDLTRTARQITISLVSRFIEAYRSVNN